MKVAADAGTSLTHLAIASPSPTRPHAAIIGPRTMDQLQDLLAGADVALDDEILDRIDGSCPAVTLNAADAGSQPPALTDPSLRRRPAARPAADARRVHPALAMPRHLRIHPCRGKGTFAYNGVAAEAPLRTKAGLPANRLSESGPCARASGRCYRRAPQRGYGEALVTGQRAGPSGPVSGRCVGDVPPRGRGAHSGGSGGRPPGDNSQHGLTP